MLYVVNAVLISLLINLIYSVLFIQNKAATRLLVQCVRVEAVVNTDSLPYVNNRHISMLN